MSPRILVATPLAALLALALGAAPAAADPPVAVPPIVIDGYAWNWQPANPNYFLATGYEHNSAGGAVQVTRSGPGTYQVRFHNMAATGGVAHASAYGSGNLCTVSSYGPSAGDEIVNVRCYTTAGVPVDTRFIANVSNRQTEHAGYLWNDDPTPPVAGHTPPAQWSYDSAGEPIVVYRSAVGRYQVHLGAFVQDSPGAWASGYLRATAYGSGARHCQILDPELAGPDLISLSCRDDEGDHVDTRFTLTYSREVMNASATVDLIPVVPALDGWSNSAGGAPTVSVLGVGDYLVSFPGAGVPRGHAVASIMGTPPMFCNVNAWWPAGGAEAIRIRCYDGSEGSPTPAIMLNVGFLA